MWSLIYTEYIPPWIYQSTWQYNRIFDVQQYNILFGEVTLHLFGTIMIHYGIIVSEFEFPLHNWVHLLINILAEGMNPTLLQAMG